MTQRSMPFLRLVPVAATLLACGQLDDASTPQVSRWTLTETKVRALLSQAGFPARQHDFMVCIAWNESSFDPAAIHYNDDGTVDYGLFQINSAYWPRNTAPGGRCADTSRLTSSALDNARCALVVLGSAPWYGQHWATYGMCAHLYSP